MISREEDADLRNHVQFGNPLLLLCFLGVEGQKDGLVFIYYPHTKIKYGHTTA